MPSGAATSATIVTDAPAATVLFVTGLVTTTNGARRVIGTYAKTGRDSASAPRSSTATAWSACCPAAGVNEPAYGEAPSKATCRPLSRKRTDATVPSGSDAVAASAIVGVPTSDPNTCPLPGAVTATAGDRLRVPTRMATGGESTLAPSASVARATTWRTPTATSRHTTTYSPVAAFSTVAVPIGVPSTRKSIRVTGGAPAYVLARAASTTVAGAANTIAPP